MGKISKPEPIKDTHELDAFESGEDALDHWLKRRALNNDKNGESRSFVVHDNNKVIAYYCLATGSVASESAPGKVKRNMPDPIPIMVLGRLAVDKKHQGQGIGKGLLKDAVLRTSNVAENAGIKAILVHAISDIAKHFYKRYGFIESPLDTMTLMLPLVDIRRYFL